VTLNSIQVLRCVLLVATAAMFFLHLGTGLLLKRGVRPVTLLRFEAAYYLVMAATLFLPQFRTVLFPVILLAALHLAGWLYSEMKMTHTNASVVPRNVIVAVQIFDWSEAVVLAWIWLTLMPV
jgi:hypothetical protein